MIKHFIIFLFALTNSIVAFPQNPNYEVYALKFTSDARVPHSMVAMDGSKTDSLTAVFMFWLIKSKNGKNILVDAGFHKDEEVAKEMGSMNYIRPDSVLLELGLKATDISDIIVTHPHWDHVGGIDLFPNAQVWIQKDDYSYFVGNAWQKDGVDWGFKKKDVRKLVELSLSGKLNLIDGDNKEIIPGIKVYTGSKHTFNSQFVLVESGVDRIIIASDNIYTYYNLDHLKSPPIPATFDTTAYVKSMERMKTLASSIKFIIPGHDALLFKRFPRITENIVRIK